MHADPQPGGDEAGPTVTVCALDVLQKAQEEKGLWEPKHATYAGQTGRVELQYPNGDMAVSFNDGEWLRLGAAATEGVKEGAERPSTESPESSASEIPPMSMFSPPTKQSEAQSVLTVSLPLKVGTPLGLDFIPNTPVVEYVAEVEGNSVYPVRTILRRGFTILEVDGVLMQTGEQVLHAVKVAAHVAGQCTMKILDDTDERYVSTIKKEKAQQHDTDAVSPPASRNDPNSTIPYPPPALVVTALHNIGSTLEQGEACLTKAQTNLEELKAAVSRQEDEIKTMESILSIRRKTTAAVDRSRKKQGAEATPEDAEKAKKKKRFKPEIVVAKEMADKAELAEAFEKIQHGKRREDVDKYLAAMGNPDLEDLDFWDLRACQEEVAVADDQIALDIFYFGEMEEAGDHNTFKVHVIDRLQKAGVSGVVAPAPLKEAGCMYPLIGFPVILPWGQALRLGNLVFEEFGIAQSAGGHGSGGGGGEGGEGGDGEDLGKGGKGGGCAQQ